MRDHRKLKVFHLADKIALLTYKITDSFPSKEQFGLTAQIRRAAVSVPSNIVEGCARETLTDYLRFLNISFSSLRELRYQLGLSSRLGFIKSDNLLTIEPIIEETEKSLSCLIKSLKSID